MSESPLSELREVLNQSRPPYPTLRRLARQLQVSVPDDVRTRAGLVELLQPLLEDAPPVEDVQQLDDAPPAEDAPIDFEPETVTQAPCIIVIDNRYLFRELFGDARDVLSVEANLALAKRQAQGLPVGCWRSGPPNLVAWADRPEGVGVLKPEARGPQVIPAGAVPAQTANAPRSAPATRSSAQPPRPRVRRRSQPRRSVVNGITVEPHPSYPGYNASSPGLTSEDGTLRVFYGGTPAEARTKAEAALSEQQKAS